MFPSNGPSDMMFTIFPIFFFIIFGLVAATFIYVLTKGISQWSSNNKQPVLVVPAKLIAKRTNVSQHVDNDSNSFNNSSTTYYLTFEFETKSRQEFRVNGEEYGLLIEGDTGKLKFQGTRYLGFER